VVVASAELYASLHLIPDNHANIPPLSFLQARCPSCRQTNSVKALKALVPLLFVIVVEALSREFRVALPWELYADDLVVIAETEDDLIKRPNEWKDNVENRGVRVSMNKTKVIINGEQ